MAANPVTPIDKPVFQAALVDARGFVSRTWLPWINSLWLQSIATSGNASAITLLQEGLALTDAELAALTARVNTAEGNITALQSSVGLLQTQVGTLAVTVRAHTLELANHEARIEALETYKSVWAIRSVSANYTVVYADFTIDVDASAGAITITLPAAGSLVTGEYHNVKKTDSTLHVVTIDGNGKLIDGAATIALLLPEWSVGLQYDGAAWRIL